MKKVPDPTKSFKPIKAIPQGSKGYFKKVLGYVKSLK